MSNLTDYIDKIKTYIEDKKDLTEDEIVRYVYLDLGARLSFDLNFSFGNTQDRKKIYEKGKTEQNLNEVLESNKAICKSGAYLLEYVLRSLGINAKTIIDYEGSRQNRFPHVYNIIIGQKEKPYIVDLQEGMIDIQTHSFTRRYGISTKPEEEPAISRKEIEQMDRKLGYIDDKNYYSDEYLYLLKMSADMIGNFAEKLQFILEQIDAYPNANIKYGERYWYHEGILKKILSSDELRKIHLVSCYEEKNNEKQYQNCIALQIGEKTDVYLYDAQVQQYKKLTIEEFAKKVKQGLVCLQGIPGLKKALRQIDNSEEGR